MASSDLIDDCVSHELYLVIWMVIFFQFIYSGDYLHASHRWLKILQWSAPKDTPLTLRFWMNLLSPREREPIFGIKNERDRSKNSVRSLASAPNLLARFLSVRAICWHWMASWVQLHTVESLHWRISEIQSWKIVFDEEALWKWTTMPSTLGHCPLCTVIQLPYPNNGDELSTSKRN